MEDFEEILTAVLVVGSMITVLIIIYIMAERKLFNDFCEKYNINLDDDRKNYKLIKKNKNCSY